MRNQNSFPKYITPLSLSLIPYIFPSLLNRMTTDRMNTTVLLSTRTDNYAPNKEIIVLVFGVFWEKEREREKKERIILFIWPCTRRIFDFQTIPCAVGVLDLLLTACRPRDRSLLLSRSIHSFSSECLLFVIMICSYSAKCFEFCTGTDAHWRFWLLLLLIVGLYTCWWVIACMQQLTPPF